ncbi:hypothetical protein C8Q74DRAFT_559995 [Fomes fomentarius]|nr:hypothetical protein C8Q74DRAFT_559995 [Fomes fomentarius]
MSMDLQDSLNLPVVAVDKDALEGTRATILADIERHARILVDLKTRLNSLTPICRLPSELLALVFVTYVDDLHHTAYSRARLMKTWITVTHVCRHWRAVALSTPRLWSYIYASNPSVCSELIVRSKSSPLFVDILLSHYDDDMSTVDLISGELPRIQQLVVAAPTRKIQSLCGAIGRTMDQLQHLSLSSLGDEFDDVLPKLPLITIEDFAPRLRRLHLHRLPFVWTDLVFHAKLDSLDVNGRFEWDGMIPELPSIGTIQQFFTAMERLAPSLENLTLEEAIPPSRGLTDGSTNVALPMRNLISFPVLRSLVLKDRSNDIAAFLSGISFRSSTTISIVGEGEMGFADIARKLSDVLSQGPPFLSAAITFSFDVMRIVVGHTPASPHATSPSDIPLDFSLDAGMLVQGNEFLSILTRESSMLFSHLQYLQITPGPFSIDWTPLLSGLPNLLTLSLVGNPGAIFPALTAVGPEDSVPLPALRVFKLRDVRSNNFTRDGERFIENLVDWAMLRCHHGVPLETLSMSECEYARETDIGLLREIVPDVDWDGWDWAGKLRPGEEYDDYDGCRHIAFCCFD